MTLELLATNYGNGNGCTCINDTHMMIRTHSSIDCIPRLYSLKGH